MRTRTVATLPLLLPRKALGFATAVALVGLSLAVGCPRLAGLGPAITLAALGSACGPVVPPWSSMLGTPPGPPNLDHAGLSGFLAGSGSIGEN